MRFHNITNVNPNLAILSNTSISTSQPAAPRQPELKAAQYRLQQLQQISLLCTTSNAILLIAHSLRSFTLLRNHQPLTHVKFNQNFKTTPMLQEGVGR